MHEFLQQSIDGISKQFNAKETCVATKAKAENQLVKCFSEQYHHNSPGQSKNIEQQRFHEY